MQGMGLHAICCSMSQWSAVATSVPRACAGIQAACMLMPAKSLLGWLHLLCCVCALTGRALR